MHTFDDLSPRRLFEEPALGDDRLVAGSLEDGDVRHDARPRTCSHDWKGAICYDERIGACCILTQNVVPRQLLRGSGLHTGMHLRCLV